MQFSSRGFTIILSLLSIVLTSDTLHLSRVSQNLIKPQDTNTPFIPTDIQTSFPSILHQNLVSNLLLLQYVFYNHLKETEYWNSFIFVLFSLSESNTTIEKKKCFKWKWGTIACGWGGMHTCACMHTHALNGIFWLSRGMKLLFCWCTEVAVILINSN